MASLIDIISVVSGGFGIIQFGMDNFHAQDATGSSLKVTVGLDVQGGLNNAGGDLPDVRLWDEAGGFLGMTADPGTVQNGETGDIKVPHNKNSAKQAPYALFSANNNAICIAYLTITWPSGEKYGWTGGWASECGGSWYYSNVYVKETDYKPNCTWIDANGDIPETGFQVHFPDFVQADPMSEANETIREHFCHTDYIFKLYYNKDPHEIMHQVLGRNRRAETSPLGVAGRSLNPSSRSRRYINETSPSDNSAFPSSGYPHAGHLVIDNSTDHSTSRLCSSDTSYGPDFANSADGRFCRMADKTLWPLCSGSVTDNCFSVDTRQLFKGGVAVRDSGYQRVTIWG